MVQMTLEEHFLRQDIIDQILAAGHEDNNDAVQYANRLMEVAHLDNAEHKSLRTPFDRSIAIVFQLVREEDLDPWNIDLSVFIKMFSKKLKKEGDKVDLPACGRLIRLAWEVLDGQASDLLERAQRVGDEYIEDPFSDWGWEMEYDDSEFSFTSNVLAGDADQVLPQIFNERVRRDEGRPVTLGELLGALKNACEDADELRLREEFRIKHAEEVKLALKNVGSRMHNEDLEGDMLRCWMALREVYEVENKKPGSPIPIELVTAQLKSDLIAEYGMIPDGLDGEAKVTSFVSSLFLTHKGLAEIWQEDIPDGPVYIRDLWPEIVDFNQILLKIISKVEEESNKIHKQKGGSDHYRARQKAIATRAKNAKRAEEAEKLSKQNIALEAIELANKTSEEEIKIIAKMEELE